MWLNFLDSDFSVNRPFVDFKQILVTDEIDFYSDASGSKTKGGLGAYFARKWIHQKWDYDFMTQNDPSIEFLELYAMATAVLLWAKDLQNKRVIIFCDNASVVQMINKSTASCRNCVELLRRITLVSLKNNVRFFCHHVVDKICSQTTYQE